jgi:hypothetical protein
MPEKYDAVVCFVCGNQLPYDGNEVVSPDGFVIGYMCDSHKWTIWGKDFKEGLKNTNKKEVPKMEDCVGFL